MIFPRINIPRELGKPIEINGKAFHLFSGISVSSHIFPQAMWFKAYKHLFLDCYEILVQEFERSNTKVLV